MSNVFTTTGACRRPRIRRSLTRRFCAAWAAFLAKPEGATNVHVEMVRGGGSARVTQMF